MSNRSLSRIVFYVGLVTTIQSALAVSIGDTGTLTMGTSYNGVAGPGQWGGEFSMVSPQLGPFKTFCIEYSEHISLSTTYDFTINSSAVNGGPTTSLPTVPFGSTSGADALSVGTAYLFNLFATGNLPAPTGTGNYVTGSHQGLLQQAFWWLEGESADPNYSSSSTSGLANPYVNLAVAALGGSVPDVRQSAAPGQYGVYALNLTVGIPGPGHQDQLFFDPSFVPPPPINAPDSGATLSLLGISASALLVWSRKIRS